MWHLLGIFIICSMHLSSSVSLSFFSLSIYLFLSRSLSISVHSCIFDTSLSAFILNHLHWLIPLPLCWGVILFYGGICITNSHLYERFKILFQAEKYHPEAHYVTSTPSKVGPYIILQLEILVFHNIIKS